MRGRSRERVLWVAVALGVWLAGGGCYYRKYDPLVRTHVELMLALAEKRLDIGARESEPPNPAEFAYPLSRARDFARIVRDRFGERASYREFATFLDRYAALLAEAAKPEADREALRRGLEALRDQGRAVIAALEAESR